MTAGKRAQARRRGPYRGTSTSIAPVQGALARKRGLARRKGALRDFEPRGHRPASGATELPGVALRTRPAVACKLATASRVAETRIECGCAGGWRHECASPLTSPTTAARATRSPRQAQSAHLAR